MNRFIYNCCLIILVIIVSSILIITTEATTTFGKQRNYSKTIMFPLLSKRSLWGRSRSLPSKTTTAFMTHYHHVASSLSSSVVNNPLQNSISVSHHLQKNNDIICRRSSSSSSRIITNMIPKQQQFQTSLFFHGRFKYKGGGVSVGTLLSEFSSSLSSSSSLSVMSDKGKNANTDTDTDGLSKQDGYNPNNYYVKSNIVEQRDDMDDYQGDDDINNEYDEQDDENSNTNSSAVFTKEELLNIDTLPLGMPKGFYIVKQYTIPKHGLTSITSILQMEDEKDVEKNDDSTATTTATTPATTPTTAETETETIITPAKATASATISKKKLQRLDSVTATNCTLPIALMIIDPSTYTSFSNTRKAIRRGGIIIHRGPTTGGDDNDENNKHNVFDMDKCKIGKVGDRVYPTDVIGKQIRMNNGFYPSVTHAKPPFDLPVVYEDDHFAIVNKPAGVVVYSHRKGGHGTMAVVAALPYVLKPPMNAIDILRKPRSVHRLDKPTSGLLIVAKTKPAMTDLSRQFRERCIKKTYTAILNGIPDEPADCRISSINARDLGFDVKVTTDKEMEDDNGNDNQQHWQLIDHALDEKSAVTIWRSLKYVKSLKANEGVLTMVEMKPKTGRYHQLRRHMAWVRERPMVGDDIYDGGGDAAMQFRHRGLFLCSNKVICEHPYYNTDIGRKEWDNIMKGRSNSKVKKKINDTNGDMLRLSRDGTTVEVHASIKPPDKFDSFLEREEERAEKFDDEV